MPLGDIDDEQHLAVQIERRMGKIETSIAVEAAHRESIEERLKRIETTLTRLTWLIIGAIVVAIVNYALSGGLLVTPQ